MRIDVLTLFPEMFGGVLGASMLGRAAEAGLLEFHVHDIRAYTENKHKKADDYPFGGGAGLVMMAQPIFDCMEAVCAMDARPARRILLTPRGRLLSTTRARALAAEERLVLLCGHYEGVDERVMAIVDEELSIGDYVLTGGELPAAIITDAIVRLIPGAIGDEQSALSDSFQDNLLAPPVYTRPAEYKGWRVPDVLLSGHQARIDDWKHEMALKRTRELRPDLLDE